MIIQVIGVSGCGKSTIARNLSKSLGIPYYDADDFHPPENVEKMKGGQPLNDEDRASWLTTLSGHLQEWEQKEGAILACSALKEKYRAVLSRGLKECHWVFLSGDYELIYERISKREGHYMNESLLKSQFEALEVPSYGIHIDINKSPTEIVNIIKSNL
ncbi:gluconokinase [Lutimonas sp.]|uniref:gluconokinase n=1 Tax=Lutimonas sp. TaxID=1872403 RepID=UPI003D9B381F